MARMPFTTWLPADDGNSRTRMSRWDIVCVHTIVGFAPAKAAHFSTRADGYTWQHRDTDFRSAANLNGNHRVIAIENEDHGAAYGSWNVNDGHAVPGFTPVQMEAIANILVFCYRAHGIPLVLAPDSRPGSRGIAYHRQGIDGNFGSYAYPGRVAGGEVWSAATGKVCPGDRRITQLIEIIIPRARVLAGLDQPPRDPDVELTDPMRPFFSRPGTTWPEDVKSMDVGSTFANVYSLSLNSSNNSAAAVAKADAANSTANAARASADAANTKLDQLLARPIVDATVAAGAVVDELIARGVTGGASKEDVEAAVEAGLNSARITTN